MSGLMLLRRSMIHSHRTFTASQSCLRDIKAQPCQQLRSHPQRSPYRSQRCLASLCRACRNLLHLHRWRLCASGTACRCFSHLDRDRLVEARHARPICAGPGDVFCTFTIKDTALLKLSTLTWTEMAWPIMPSQSTLVLKGFRRFPKGGRFLTASSYTLTWTEIAWSRPTMLGQSAHALKKRYTSSPPLALPFSGPSATCISTLQRHQSTLVAHFSGQGHQCLASLHRP